MGAIFSVSRPTTLDTPHHRLRWANMEAEAASRARWDESQDDQLPPRACRHSTTRPHRMCHHALHAKVRQTEISLRWQILSVARVWLLCAAACRWIPIEARRSQSWVAGSERCQACFVPSTACARATPTPGSHATPRDAPKASSPRATAGGPRPLECRKWVSHEGAPGQAAQTISAPSRDFGGQSSVRRARWIRHRTRCRD